MELILYFLLVNIVCVSSQVIKGDNICSNDEAGELDFLSDMVRQQAKQIQELSEKVRAQDDTTKNKSGQFGREFILAFPDVNATVIEIQLLIVSRSDGSINITSDETGVDRIIEISSENGVALTLPNTLSKTGSYVGHKTALLTSDIDIAVFVLVLGLSGSGDGYMAIPSKSLEDNYFFSTNHYAMLSIVSIYNDTQISISSTAGTTIDLKAMGLSSINSHIILDRGEVLQIKHTSWVYGHVWGSNPFMLLHGSYKETVLSKYKASYIESLFSNNGHVFVVPYLYNETDTATLCENHGNGLAFSDANIFKRTNYLFIRGQTRVSFIRTFFQTSCHYIGHGFSVSVPPVSSYAPYCRFLTPYQNRFSHHSVVLIKNEYINDLKFRKIDPENNVIFDREEVIFVDGVSYSALYYVIQPGQYEVYNENPDATFGVILYGFGKGIDAAYGFPVCFQKL